MGGVGTGSRDGGLGFDFDITAGPRPGSDAAVLAFEVEIVFCNSRSICFCCSTSVPGLVLARLPPLLALPHGLLWLGGT